MTTKIDLKFILADCCGDIGKAQRRIDRALEESRSDNLVGALYARMDTFEQALRQIASHDHGIDTVMHEIAREALGLSEKSKAEQKGCPAINSKVCGNALCQEHFPGPDLSKSAYQDSPEDARSRQVVAGSAQAEGGEQSEQGGQPIKTRHCLTTDPAPCSSQPVTQAGYFPENVNHPDVLAARRNALDAHERLYTKPTPAVPDYCNHDMVSGIGEDKCAKCGEVFEHENDANQEAE